jgi:hypothetical protein
MSLPAQGFINQPSIKKQQTTPSPTEPFPLKRLPKELRLKIYPLNSALSLSYTNEPPPLLLALAADPDMYAEARHLYLTQNASISHSSQEAFRKWRMSRILQLKHIRLHWGDLDAGRHRRLRGNKICLKNNLESILLIVGKVMASESREEIWMEVDYLCVASLKGVRRIIGVFNAGRIEMTQMKLRMQNILNVQGVLVEKLGDGEVWEWVAAEEEGFKFKKNKKLVS